MTQLTGDPPQPNDGSESPASAPANLDAGSENGVPSTPSTLQRWEDGFCTALEEYSGPLELLLYLIHSTFRWHRYSNNSSPMSQGLSSRGPSIYAWREITW